MVLDPIPQSLPVHFFGSRPQPPTSRFKGLFGVVEGHTCFAYVCMHIHICECVFHTLYVCICLPHLRHSVSRVFVASLRFTHVSIYVYIYLYIYFVICVYTSFELTAFGFKGLCGIVEIYTCIHICVYIFVCIFCYVCICLSNLRHSVSRAFLVPLMVCTCERCVDVRCSSCCCSRLWSLNLGVQRAIER